MSKKSKLPIGVSSVANRPGLFRLQITLHGKRHSEYFRVPDDTHVRKRNSQLQKAIDEFRHKCETGAIKGQITDKSTLAVAYEWYIKQKSNLGTLRESTIITSDRFFSTYILPRFGHLPLKMVTSAMITDFFSDLLENGGTKTGYTARPALIDKIKGKGSVEKLAPDVGVSRQCLFDIREQKSKAYFDSAGGFALT